MADRIKQIGRQGHAGYEARHGDDGMCVKSALGRQHIAHQTDEQQTQNTLKRQPENHMSPSRRRTQKTHASESSSPHQTVNIKRRKTCLRTMREHPSAVKEESGFGTNTLQGKNLSRHHIFLNKKQKNHRPELIRLNRSAQPAVARLPWQIKNMHRHRVRNQITSLSAVRGRCPNVKNKKA